MAKLNLDFYIGENITINVIKNLVGNGMFPMLSLFYGIRGTGKSTVAEAVGNAITGNIVKINMAKYNMKSDVEKILDDIVKFKKVDKTTYILEEVHAINKDAQTAILEEILKARDYVIMVTTEINKLSRPLVDRLTQFKFKEPSKEECYNFFTDSKVISKSTQKLVIEYANRNPRVILNIKHVLTYGRIGELKYASDFLGYYDTENMCEFINKLSGSASKFADMLSEDNLPDYLTNLSRMSLELIRCRDAEMSVSKNLKEFVKLKFNKFNDYEFMDLMELFSSYNEFTTNTLNHCYKIRKHFLAKSLIDKDTLQKDTKPEITELDDLTTGNNQYSKIETGLDADYKVEELSSKTIAMLLGEE